MGYVAAEEHATNEVGVIPLDASFSPVLQVEYKVEAARVGRSSNFDKVRLSLTTDGTITPTVATTQSALYRFLRLFQLHRSLRSRS